MKIIPLVLGALLVLSVISMVSARIPSDSLKSISMPSHESTLTHNGGGSSKKYDCTTEWVTDGKKVWLRDMIATKVYHKKTGDVTKDFLIKGKSCKIKPQAHPAPITIASYDNTPLRIDLVLR